jgi:CBS domain-containing protein
MTSYSPKKGVVMKVQDVMTQEVETCWPDTNLAAAAAMMWENDCGVLPVVADEGKAIGVITDRDIAIALGTRNKIAADLPVAEVMSARLVTASPEEDIHTALKLMRKEKLHRLPVVNNDGVLKGILSLNDVALQAVHSDGKRAPELSYEDVVSTLKAVCEHNQALVLKDNYLTAKS